MRALLARLLFAVLLISPAAAMQQSDAPARFNVPWANTAVAPYINTIPQASQIGITNCAASLTDGFPPLTFVPAGSGGCPPFGKDFNGILKQITQWSRWSAAGGPMLWDSTFSTQIGGYPKGAMVQSNVLVGRIWFSTADNNTTNPDATDGTSANWTVLPGTAYPGQVSQTMGTSAPPNTVSANGRTVGNAASNATSRANADTFWLFVRIWTDCPNTQCQLFNSGGGAIGRGATAVADFAANNAIATYAMNGATLTAADTQGGVAASNLTSAPVVIGSRSTPGSILGENTHVLTVGELATHSHPITDQQHNHSYQNPTGTTASVQGGGTFPAFPFTSGSTNTSSSFTGITTTNNQGSNTPHNIVSRTFLTSNWLAL